MEFSKNFSRILGYNDFTHFITIVKLEHLKDFTSLL